jgi:fibronectin-binding autotransporter adhesin
MADQKISMIWAGAPAAAFTGTTHLEAEIGGLEKGVSGAQIATYIQTALASLILSGGLVSLNADGSASFASGAILINGDGSASFGSGAVLINADGSASFGGQIFLDTSGGVAIFFNNAVRIGDSDVTVGGAGNAGSIQVKEAGGLTIAGIGGDGSIASGGNSVDGVLVVKNAAGGNTIQLSGIDGSARFGGGADGSVTLTSAAGFGRIFLTALDATLALGSDIGAGAVIINDLNGNPIINLNGDGSISFAGGQFTVAAVTGVPSVNSLPGMTTDVVVLVDLMGTTATLHYEGGLLTSVT